jgi:type IV secretory pathway VirB3-like protein
MRGQHQRRKRWALKRPPSLLGFSLSLAGFLLSLSLVLHWAHGWADRYAAVMAFVLILAGIALNEYSRIRRVRHDWSDENEDEDNT